MSAVSVVSLLRGSSRSWRSNARLRWATTVGSAAHQTLLLRAGRAAGTVLLLAWAASQDFSLLAVLLAAGSSVPVFSEALGKQDRPSREIVARDFVVRIGRRRD